MLQTGCCREGIPESRDSTDRVGWQNPIHQVLNRYVAQASRAPGVEPHSNQVHRPGGTYEERAEHLPREQHRRLALGEPRMSALEGLRQIEYQFRATVRKHWLEDGNPARWSPQCP
jgi:hypothetical protein